MPRVHSRRGSSWGTGTASHDSSIQSFMKTLERKERSGLWRINRNGRKAARAALKTFFTKVKKQHIASLLLQKLDSRRQRKKPLEQRLTTRLVRRSYQSYKRRQG